MSDAPVAETQESIAQWAEETFGSDVGTLRMVVRAHEELSELMRKTTTGQSTDEIVEEAADVVIVLCRLAERYGVKLTKGEKITSHRMLGTIIEADKRFSMLFGTLELEHWFAGIDWCSRSIYSCMEQVCLLIGVDLWAEVEKKMAINRTRQWRTDGTGHGYHVRQGE